MSARLIAQLNDVLRTTMFRGPVHGEIMITDGIAALPYPMLWQIVDQVRDFDAFTPDNDPHGEHDFGSIEHPACGHVF